MKRSLSTLFDASYVDSLASRDRPLRPALVDNPKSPVANFAARRSIPLNYVFTNVDKRVIRCSLHLDIHPRVIAIGDAPDKKSAERLCALSALYQLHSLGLIGKPPKPVVSPPPDPPAHRTLSDGSVISYDRARSFMDYYCRIYGFQKPVIHENCVPVENANSVWEAVISVDGRRIGMGSASTKKTAHNQCYLDVTQYLESCDPPLWQRYLADAKSGKDLGLAPNVVLSVRHPVAGDVLSLCSLVKQTSLYKGASAQSHSSPLPPLVRPPSGPYPSHLASLKSAHLQKNRHSYLADPATERIRAQRASLPIYSRAPDLVSHIANNDVTICMAATGSGKTTQVPQLILDDYIDRGQGACCNIICTQPRRLAALSVANRVAKERGEALGDSVGYSVRFESNLPKEHGSITFCTVGVLLKRIRSAMSDGGLVAAKLDQVTHILVDEVHERDVDTDLLLFVLKRLMEDRKARNLPLKVVLMSATIDPQLFQDYFPDAVGNEASVVQIPGRTFPVTKHYLEDFLPDIKARPQLAWLFDDESVSKYLAREEAYPESNHTSSPHPFIDDEQLPAPLVAATVAHVLERSNSGHILIFLPGWEEISSVRSVLLQGKLPVDFGDQSKYTIHVLHSAIPLAEQQVIFDPAPDGVRRIILATNIAETSVTIPDVVYVIDTGKIKELRYDPDRHMSSLVSAWVGTSNLNQRAGRAGRHRPGEYFSLLSQARATSLHPHQTVEMKRVDLSNVVMHVKALNLPGMEAEDVLGAVIEPPASDRVVAAMKTLQLAGALDGRKNLTSLGRVLLQLPVEVQMGRLLLYGVFFRCLDKALTLAAIFTSRDPFLSPLQLRAEAAAVKATWCPNEFRSDALTILNVYEAWHDMYSRGEHARATRFCTDNFLSKPTLLLITKVREHLLRSLHQAGIIDAVEGGRTRYRERTVPPALNVNANSRSLLVALVTVATQPKFAVRTGQMTLRTQHDKVTFIHPSSVNHRKHVKISKDDATLPQGEKQIYAYVEKRQNLTNADQNPQTYLINTTRLDPLTYLLFGANDIQTTDYGLECDEWLPIVGNLNVLDDIQRLKTMVETCMLRVFQGIHLSKISNATREDETGEETAHDLSLSPRELSDLDSITQDIVDMLDRFGEERMSTQSATSSRNATPMASPAFSSSRLPGPGSGYSTPYGRNSRPGTPNRFWRSFYS